jgi:hypothetical protein
MKAWMLAATLATSVGFTVGARADESATERTQAGDKASKAEATAEIVVAHGSNSGKGIDPKLARHKELKSPPFSSYDSYALLEEGTRALTRGKPSALKLPDGGELSVTLDNVEEKAGKPSRYVVKASIKKPGGEESTVQVKAKPGAMFFVAGQKFEKGILVLGIRMR